MLHNDRIANLPVVRTYNISWSMGAVECRAASPADALRRIAGIPQAAASSLASFVEWLVGRGQTGIVLENGRVVAAAYADGEGWVA